MKNFEKIKAEQAREEKNQQKRESFIKENYPAGKSSYDIEDLLASGFEGRQVLEKHDDHGDLEGILSYDLGKDHEGSSYCSIGIMLTREESQGEGVMGSLFDKIKEIAKEKNCEYLTAIADTQEGEQYLLGRGFYAQTDPVNGREHLRYDLD